jgi:hypothetical protein
MAATRAKKIKIIQKEAIRAKFKGIEYVRQLELCHKEYEKTFAAMASARKKKLTAKDKEELVVIANQLDCLKLGLDIIKAKVDLNIRRLKFVIPELKSTELVDPNGENPLAPLAEFLKEALG